MTNPPPANQEWLEDEELNTLYKSGAIFDADADKIIEFLKRLGTKAVPNWYIHHAYIIRGITANAVLIRRYMERVEKQNTFYTKVVVFLTAVAAVSAIAQIGLQIYVIAHK